MTRSTCFNKIILLSMFLALGCTGSGTMGCSGDASGPTVDSQLTGIYEVSRYQQSPIDPVTQEPVPGACDMLADVAVNGALFVLYPFAPNDEMDEAVLAGVFCGDLEQCREFARDQVEPQFGYSFDQGSDEAGWVGFGNARQGREQDQCLVEIQTHTLTATGDSIRIDTEGVEVIYPPDMSEGQEVTCSVAEAVRRLTPDLPCSSKFLLEAMRTANL